MGTKKKIDIKHLERRDARAVCFSKRRKGLFQKVSEVSILCGVVVGVVVFSPAGRPYSFGSPSIDSLIKCFLGICNISGVQNKVCWLISHYEDLEKKLEELIEAEKLRTKMLEERERENGGSLMHYYSTGNIDALELDELKEIYKKIEAIDDVINGKTNQEEERNQATSLDLNVVPVDDSVDGPSLMIEFF
ncbi:hypothetical protein EJB05_14800, partial [Eragrostis curvula]